MAEWTHQICDKCWEVREGTRIPVRVMERDPQLCCICGESNTSCIWFRCDPIKLPNCKGHLDG